METQVKSVTLANHFALLSHTSSPHRTLAQVTFQLLNSLKGGNGKTIVGYLLLPIVQRKIPRALKAHNHTRLDVVNYHHIRLGLASRWHVRGERVPASFTIQHVWPIYSIHLDSIRRYANRSGYIPFSCRAYT